MTLDDPARLDPEASERTVTAVSAVLREADAATARELDPGLAHLKRVRHLADGGMGSVILARDERLGRDVVVKAVHRDLLARPEARARFLREAKLLSRLRHPAICQLYEYVEGRDGDYLVLELIEGRTLKKALAEDDLDERSRLRIGLEVAEVLETAHQAGVVHRDLKPTNLMLTQEGSVKILDFGIAHADEDLGGWGFEALETASGPVEELDRGSRSGSMTATGTRTGQLTTLGAVIGTPSHMSPEQARGEAVTPASDVYSLGILLQELFSSIPPHPRELTARRLLDRARVGLAEDPRDVAPVLRRLILAMRDPEPGRRPTTTEVARRLRSYRDRGRRWTRTAVAAALAGLALVGAAKYTIDLRQERREVAEARAEAEELINFLLEDLYDGLAPLGRTELLREVATRVEGYYRRLPPERRKDSPVRVVRALRHVGDVFSSQGRFDEAGVVLEEAERFADVELAARPGPVDPGDPLLGERARVLVVRAGVDESRGDLTGAIERYQRALEGFGDGSPWPEDRARTLEALGVAFQSRHDLDAALERFEGSRRLWIRLVEENADDPLRRAELAGAWEHVGDVGKLRGRLDDAEEAYQRARRLLEDVVKKDPHNAEWLNDLAVVWDDLGDLRVRSGDLEGALAAYGADLEIARRLAGDDPTNRRRQLAVTYPMSAIGEVLTLIGQPREAEAMLREAEQIVRELLAIDRENSDWLDRLAENLELLGVVREVEGRWEDARALYEETLSVRRRLLERDPSHTQRRRELASSLLRLGSALQALGDERRGRALLGESLEVLDQEGDEESSIAHLRAEALLRLGRVAQAEPWIRVLHERGGFRDPRQKRVEALWREVGTRRDYFE